MPGVLNTPLFKTPQDRLNNKTISSNATWLMSPVCTLHPSRSLSFSPPPSPLCPGGCPLRDGEFRLWEKVVGPARAARRRSDDPRNVAGSKEEALIAAHRILSVRVVLSVQKALKLFNELDGWPLF